MVLSLGDYSGILGQHLAGYPKLLQLETPLQGATTKCDRVIVVVAEDAYVSWIWLYHAISAVMCGTGRPYVY